MAAPILTPKPKRIRSPKQKLAATHGSLLHDNTKCSHLHLARFTKPEPGQYETGCIDCNAIGEHGNWKHLRQCLLDGEIRCCDSSPNQHASKHAAASGDPIARSVEPNESWVYCYDQQILALKELPTDLR